jgi:hypothetical protein
MARQCGICKRAPREGAAMQAVRVRNSDFAGFTPEGGEGLYSACEDCVASLKPRIVERINAEYGTQFTPEDIPPGYLV